jgi:RNA recognition motif-containing protein
MNHFDSPFCSFHAVMCADLFLAELKRSLYALCSQYGKILDIVALKTPKLRGQAWVAFSEITSATNAFRGLRDFDFYGKSMVNHLRSSRLFPTVLFHLLFSIFSSLHIRSMVGMVCLS